jgi:hypothetical protein
MIPPVIIFKPFVLLLLRVLESLDSQAPVYHGPDAVPV